MLLCLEQANPMFPFHDLAGMERLFGNDFEHINAHMCSTVFVVDQTCSTDMGVFSSIFEFL